MNKTVYVLGAGFSMSAGAPSQEKIVKEIFQLARSNPSALKKEYVDAFRNFLTNNLLIPKNLHDFVPLEDVFTPLDRCVADNIAFRELSVFQVKEIRHIVYYLIGKTLAQVLRKAGSKKEYVNTFAKHIAKECSKRASSHYTNIDPISVISTNWDILLDVSLTEAMNTYRSKGIKAVVDYCCHVSSHIPNDPLVKPGLEILGQGGFNAKLLKLHGSLNWLQCPRCLRNYVDMDHKIAISQYEEKHPCRHCNNHFGIQSSHELVSNLVMPTFLKDFTNPQYKLIWQNAGIELAEAEKIVFIGYSLPQADFEMRQLLSRMIQKNAVIEVVDFGKSANSANIKVTTKRYEVFFGNRLKKPIYWKGAEKYVLENFKDK